MQEDQQQPASVPYLAQLAEQLMLGVNLLPPEVRARHAAYLCAAQNADGGFSGAKVVPIFTTPALPCAAWLCSMP